MRLGHLLTWGLRLRLTSGGTRWLGQQRRYRSPVLLVPDASGQPEAVDVTSEPRRPPFSSATASISWRSCSSSSSAATSAAILLAPTADDGPLRAGRARMARIGLARRTRGPAALCLPRRRAERRPRLAIAHCITYALQRPIPLALSSARIWSIWAPFRKVPPGLDKRESAKTGIGRCLLVLAAAHAQQ